MDYLAVGYLEAMILRYFPIIFLPFLLSLLFSSVLRADAVIRTNAMNATTIVEYHIEDKGILVELEIGIKNMEAFRYVFPDNIYNQMGFESLTQAERRSLFFNKDFPIVADGKKLKGSLVKLGSASRIQRDKITGEPLDIQQPEPVIRAQLLYPFFTDSSTGESIKPKALVFGETTSSDDVDIGFVAYHRGVAVNDFRYLAKDYTLELDWQDPWYSKFTQRFLRRQYFAPISAFIYVDTFEVRKEIVVRPKDIQRWIDLGLNDVDVISVEKQGEIKLKVAEFLAKYHPVTIDGKKVKGQLQRINFLDRTLSSSRVVDSSKPLRIDSAILGVIFSYPTTGLPEKVVMDWDLWDERIKIIPAAIVDEAGSFPIYIQKGWTQLTWLNLLQNPSQPTLTQLSAPPTLVKAYAYKWRWLMLGAAIILAIWLVVYYKRQRKWSLSILSTTSMLVLGVVVGFHVANSTYTNSTQIHNIVSGLLHNVYRAFDYRDEKDIYDVLDKSVNGELLTEIYLETQKSLKIANQGGARAKVKNIDLKSLQINAASHDTLQVKASWIVTGMVGHWGHTHQRVNQYQADLTLSPTDGSWKLTQMNVLEENRL